MKRFVLVVEDELVIGEIFVSYFRMKGYESAHALTIKDALDLYWKVNPDVVLVDNNMPDGLGIEFVKAVRSCDPVTKLIMVTANGQAENAVDALKAGANDYLVKPVGLEKIVDCVEKLLETDRFSLGLENQPSGFHGRKLSHIAGRSPQLSNMRSLIQSIIRNERMSPHLKPPSVLIMGETGSGKSLIASTLHHEGPRRSFPCFEVSCDSISEQSADEVLFRLERGGFTNRGVQQQGLFPSAEGGTLIFDSIEELPMSVQGKLLHVMEAGHFGTEADAAHRNYNVRVIATTAVDLRERVSQGRFRPELLYRLDVMSICTTPLREIPDDIDIIANVLLDELRRKYEIGGLQLAEDERRQLLEKPWHGNVRELYNHLERWCLAKSSLNETDVSEVEFSSSRLVERESQRG